MKNRLYGLAGAFLMAALGVVGRIEHGGALSLAWLAAAFIVAAFLMEQAAQKI